MTTKLLLTNPIEPLDTGIPVPRGQQRIQTINSHSSIFTTLRAYPVNRDELEGYYQASPDIPTLNRTTLNKGKQLSISI